MATIRQVENSIATLVDSVVYPSGHLMPSITGNLVRIVIGYPISEQLDNDVAAGIAQIRVFPIGKSDKNTTRFPKIWNTVNISAPTLTSTVLNNTITIGGSVSVPQAVLVNLNGTLYGYSVILTDTTSTIASALAALIPGASAIANVITITGAILKLTASVVVNGQSAKEIKRQVKIFYVSIYAPTPDQRDILGDAVDVVLGNVERLDFQDTTQAIIVYKGADEIDIFEKNIIYERDLLYTVEYPTMIYQEDTVIEGIDLNLTT